MISIKCNIYSTSSSINISSSNFERISSSKASALEAYQILSLWPKNYFEYSFDDKFCHLFHSVMHIVLEYLPQGAKEFSNFQL